MEFLEWEIFFLVQLLSELRPYANICVCIFCNHCNVTVVYSPENGVNNPQHHQRILNSESSGHDSVAHSESPRTVSLLLRNSRSREKGEGMVKWKVKAGGRNQKERKLENVRKSGGRI